MNHQQCQPQHRRLRQTQIIIDDGFTARVLANEDEYVTNSLSVSCRMQGLRQLTLSAQTSSFLRGYHGIRMYRG